MIREFFFDFVELQRAEAIIACLHQNNIDISRCRGQSYDGASAKSSDRVGVQSRIKVVAPLAIYTHCNSHVLNLSIAGACHIPSIRNMIDVINEVFLFYNSSPKRQRFFEHILEALGSESSKRKLRGLCQTRWVERHTCYETFYELYFYICCCCEAMINPSVNAEKHVQDGWDWDSDKLKDFYMF